MRVRPGTILLSIGAFLLITAVVMPTVPPVSSHFVRAADAAFSDRPVDFIRDIQPIFKAACYECHGVSKQKGRLRLDAKSIAMEGGKSGKAIVPRHSADSLLYQRITTKDEDERMPADHDPLPTKQIAVIKLWLDQGAEWPDSASEKVAKIEKHWAFIPPTHPDAPVVRNGAWPHSAIDAFILARLEKENLTPAPEADRATLIRRASLDLIGIPPAPLEVDAFVNDPAPDAYERLIDHLLASPMYGERWARHWLDLARYAESEGFKSDETRPDIWRYRDYVIKSFNDDKPYDRFIREQIAGDELWPNDFDARIATAFNRHYPDEYNARNLWQRRQEILNDITDTVGAVFTGLTIACARCHNHKYDDITQADYYKLQSFFANIRALDDAPLATPEQIAEYDRQLALWEEKTKDIREQMAKLEAPKRNALLKDFEDKYPAEIRAALAKPATERNPLEWQFYYKAMLYMDPKSHQYQASTTMVLPSLKGEAKEKWEALKAELDKFASLKPAPLPKYSAICDANRQAPPTFILRRGGYDAPTQEVRPGFLSAISSDPPRIVPPEGLESTGRRTALANWLASPTNPLTARLMVNRIWNYHFGRGIVGTPSDFGTQGERPTHPALLDWLATEFIAKGWSIKSMHRLIMTSSTYRQSSTLSDMALKADADGKLLSHFPRRRLEGEAIRDSALAVAGMLNCKMGGPSVYPEIPAGMDTHGAWKTNSDLAERNRRSIYVFVRRNTPYPMFEAFDSPDTHESCSRRYVSTTPIQALTLLNSKLTLEWAQGLAGRALNEAGADEEKQITAAFRLAIGRAPSDKERSLIRSFLEKQRPIVRERMAAGQPLALPTGTDHKLEPADGAVLVDFCHVLINSNEFVYYN